MLVTETFACLSLLFGLCCTVEWLCPLSDCRVRAWETVRNQSDNLAQNQPPHHRLICFIGQVPAAGISTTSVGLKVHLYSEPQDFSDLRRNLHLKKMAPTLKSEGALLLGNCHNLDLNSCLLAFSTSSN